MLVLTVNMNQELFPYKNQIAFSCTMEDENIQIILYNKTNLMNDSYIINAPCENNNELSKLYFNDNKNYLIYSCFKNCSDKNYENDTYCINEKEKEEEKKEKEKEEEKKENEKEEENKEKEEKEKEKEEENKEKEEEEKKKKIKKKLKKINGEKKKKN